MRLLPQYMALMLSLSISRRESEDDPAGFRVETRK